MQTDTYERASHYETMRQFGLKLPINLFSMSLFGVDLPDLDQIEGISVSHQINFDANCIRFDFDSQKLRQQKVGEKNGLKMVWKLPKVNQGNYENVGNFDFPRRNLKLTPMGAEPPNR